MTHKPNHLSSDDGSLELITLPNPWARPDVDIAMQHIVAEYYPLQMEFSNIGDLIDAKVIELSAGAAGGTGAGVGAAFAGSSMEDWTGDEGMWMTEYWTQEWDNPGHSQQVASGWQPSVLGYSSVKEAIELEDYAHTGDLQTDSSHGSPFAGKQTMHYIARFQQEEAAFGQWAIASTTADTYAGPVISGEIDQNEQLYLGSLFGYPPGGNELDIIERAKGLAKDILTSDVENQIINPLIGYGRLKDKS